MFLKLNDLVKKLIWHLMVESVSGNHVPFKRYFKNSQLTKKGFTYVVL
jgi:hypothetical protein